MSTSVQGQAQAGINLTTTFTGGTAGNAKELNNLGTTALQIGPGQTSGLQVTDCWSQTYTNVSAPFTIDLTALPGVAGRTVSLSVVKFGIAWNCDSTAGHNFNIEPGASNGFAAPWIGTSPGSVVNGGMPNAGITNGQPVGNTWQLWSFGAGITVDATHKTLTIDPGTNTISTLVLAFGG